MIRLIVAFLLFLLSLLTILPIPARQAWYPAIAASEFPWIWLIASVVLIVFSLYLAKYRLPALTISGIALILFSVPVVRAWAVGSDLEHKLGAAFGVSRFDLQAPHREQPFSLIQMISGAGAKKVPYTTHQYAPGGIEHSLNVYPAQMPGIRPCLVIVHGGSWKSGNNGELPDVNSYFAKAGYQVVSINYRLAPEFRSPAPYEDVHAAFSWLRAHAEDLKIDTAAFVLMGRSAGGQIVLNSAYSLRERGLRGVVSFYGPTDMIFAYNDEHNPLVMDHRQVMRDFFGGSPDEVRQRYVEGSPVQYVNAQSVPTLMVHGMLDEHVHFRESQILDQKLQEAGVPHFLLGLPWATHGCEYSLNGPSGQLAVFTVERFLWLVTHAPVA